MLNIIDIHDERRARSTVFGLFGLIHHACIQPVVGLMTVVLLPYLSH